MHRDIVNHSPDSPALLRGEGWGEGLYPQALKPLLDLYPLTRIASAMQHSRSECFGVLKKRPPKAAYASPRKRGEVKNSLCTE